MATVKSGARKVGGISHGLIDGYTATCYPADEFIKSMASAYVNKSVEVCKNLITANGPKSAFEFSLEICKALNVTPKF